MAKKNGNGKEKKLSPVREKRQEHPFGEPSERAKGYKFPSSNPILHVYAGKSVTNLPQNLQDLLAAVEKHKDGVALKDLKVPKLSAKTLAWLVRQLCKHEYIRVKAEEKPESKKTTKKEGQK